MSNRVDALIRQATRQPDKAALIFEDQTFTYADLLREVRSRAAGLAQAGIRRGQKIGLMLETAPEFILLEHAAFMLGVVVVPMNMHYRSNEVEHVLGTCDVEFLVIEAAFADRLAADLHTRCPALAAILVQGTPPAPLALPMRDAAVLRGDPAACPPPADLDDDDLALMLYTSATTGKAKGVMLSLGNLSSNYDRTPEWLGLQPDEVILCSLPLYNTFALNQCINALVFLGATMVLLRRFDAVACMAAIQRHRCTFFPAVPTMLQKVFNHPEAPDYDLTSLRRIVTGGAPVPAPVLALVHAFAGTQITVITGYGLTEATALNTIHDVRLGADGQLHRPKSVGRALPGIDIAIQDEAGNEVPFGTIGEICIKGACVMKGYYKLPEMTAEAIRDGWLHTGDLGQMEPDGHFAVVDRKKDLIIRGGQNIYPADIEEALYTHPAVAEAAVIAEPDDLMGEVPKAYVALKPGASATPEALLAHSRTLLASYKVPATLQILAELPKGPTGKILRRSLRSDT
ncbi:MAG TPA: AMP-binding protein [Acetobacteraceae bacterium]|nr:AMP-binding protein [Acetobacteraceae bacterium]